MSNQDHLFCLRFVWFCYTRKYKILFVLRPKIMFITPRNWFYDPYQSFMGFLFDLTADAHLIFSFPVLLFAVRNINTKTF